MAPLGALTPKNTTESQNSNPVALSTGLSKALPLPVAALSVVERQQFEKHTYMGQAALMALKPLEQGAALSGVTLGLRLCFSLAASGDPLAGKVVKIAEADTLYVSVT